MFDGWKITLASQSPRRRELLAGLGVGFAVETAKDALEAYDASMPYDKVPEFIARHKSESFHRPLAEREILITADTMVFLDGVLIGKPADREDAHRMLRMLSGKTHTVFTGVVLRTASEIRSFTDRSDVTFRELSDGEIYHYIDTCNPLDKAGSYGAQDWIGLAAVASINGSFFNVMGLPAHRVYEELCLITGEIL